MERDEDGHVDKSLVRSYREILWGKNETYWERWRQSKGCGVSRGDWEEVRDNEKERGCI